MSKVMGLVNDGNLLGSSFRSGRNTAKLRKEAFDTMGR